MISFEQALAVVDETLGGRSVDLERVAALQARGRVLAQPAVSRLDMPAFDKSAMDGYAVMADDRREEYRVLEHVPAGRMPARALEPGAAVKVMTGAAVPPGAGRVIMIEDTDRGNEIVRVFQHKGAANICKKGEDVRIGQTILPSGRKLDSVAVANLVACGISTVQVARRIRLAILATGNELVLSAQDITPGKIMNSNGPMLWALAEENDLQVVSEGIVRDDPAELTKAICDAADRADLVALSGGVSEGDFDFVPDSLKQAGFTIHFDRVSMQPGRPITFATRADRVAIGLPGNPVSVFISFHLFLLRCAALLSGAKGLTRCFTVAMGKDIRRTRGDRTALVPCILDRHGLAEAVPYHGSAHLMALCGADGFVQIPKGVDCIPAGAKAVFYPIMLKAH